MGRFLYTSFGTQVAVANLTVALLLIGCGKTSVETLSDGQLGSDQPKLSPFDVNQFPLNKLVCDPMSAPPDQSTLEGGLHGALYYMPQGAPILSSVQPYFTSGILSEQYMFFSQINVPTRMFSQGFPLETGGLVKNDMGDDLLENFAIKLSSNIILDPRMDQEGLYQLAILSDDGAVLEEINADGSVTTLVNNDGQHPTKMGCGTNTIDMRWGQRRKIQFKYYQGPRYHISAILMWRPVLASNVALDQSCGSEGNELFFNPNQNSAPKAGYTNLLARGWRPLGMGNYSIRSNSAPYNPCVRGVAPVISDFAVEELTPGTIRATWKTDIDATSQVRVVTMSTGHDDLSLSDNILRKSHSVVVSNLPFNTNLMVQGVSISSSYGKTLSAPMSFQIHNE